MQLEHWMNHWCQLKHQEKQSTKEYCGEAPGDGEAARVAGGQAVGEQAQLLHQSLQPLA